MNQVVLQAFFDELEKISAEALEKDSLFGLGKAVAKAPFKPSFLGHTKAIQQAVKPGTVVDPRKVVQTTAWNPMTQSATTSRYVTGVEGWA